MEKEKEESSREIVLKFPTVDDESSFEEVSSADITVQEEDCFLVFDGSSSTNVVSSVQPVKRIAKESHHRQELTTNANNIIKNGDGDSFAMRKRKQSSSRNASTGGASVGGSGKDGDCLRRIKREWKEVVQMGIAYDWTNMRTINNQRKKINNSLRIANNDRDCLRIGPFNKNILRWHFSISGPPNSVYENGVYHGLILLPKNYPAMPPRIQMLTPNGRFMTNVDICLSASNYHPETWTPKWTILSLVNALRLHMLTLANEIGGMMSSDERKRWYAKESRVWRQSYSYLCGNGGGVGVVVVDHVHMVASGDFPPSSTEPGMTMRKTTEDDDESLSSPIDNDNNNSNEQEASMNEYKGLACYAEGESSEINDLASLCTRTQPKCNIPKAFVIPPQEEAAKSSRAAKIKQNKRKSSTFLRSSSNTEQELKGRIISNIIFKRLIVEVLKLPLQILSIVLKVLCEVESCLRAIIDIVS